jgi:hypothetical protein
LCLKKLKTPRLCRWGICSILIDARHHHNMFAGRPTACFFVSDGLVLNLKRKAV